MKKLYAMLAGICLSATIANAQCDNQRYLAKIFTDSAKSTVVYTEANPNDATVTNQSMDIYQPTGDAATQNRKAILFVHGGSFIGGSKTDAYIVSMCKAFAQRGYVTASIDYRLATGAQQAAMLDSNKAYPVVLRSIGDAKAAIRYLKRNAASLRIDSNWIVLAGESAGGIIVDHINYVKSLSEVTSSPLLMAAFDTVGGLEGNSGNAGYTSRAKAVLNLAGALLFTDFITTDDTEPIYSAQGNADQTVPYQCGRVLHQVSNISVCGAGAMKPVLDSKGLRNQLHTFANQDHVPWEGNALMADTVETESAQFLYNIDCLFNSIKETTGATIGLYPNPASSQITISAEEVMESVTIIDRLGRTASTTAVTGTEGKIDISRLSPGVYIAKVSLKAGGSAVKTFTVE